MTIFRFLRLNSVKIYKRCPFNYCQKRFYSYEGDGKTTVSFLSREAGDLLMITGYNKLGFRLSSGLFVVGPVIVFPKIILSWNVANDDDVSCDSLALFSKLQPPVDLLVIGLGDDNSFKDQKKYMDKFMKLQQSDFNFEMLKIDKAISTYNFLCIENRFVAAALIPPVRVDIKSGDVFTHNFEENMEGKDDYFLGDSPDDHEKMFEKRELEKTEKFIEQKMKGRERGNLMSLFKFRKDDKKRKK